MKEVIAVVRPERWLAVKTAAAKAGATAFTQHRVLGRGRTRGLAYLPKKGADAGSAVTYLPKRLALFLVPDDGVDGLVAALIAAGRTGSAGDGKVFVLPVQDAVRLRDGARGEGVFAPDRVTATMRQVHAG